MNTVQPVRAAAPNIETIARAICAASCDGCGMRDRHTLACVDGWQECLAEAKAVADLIEPGPTNLAEALDELEPFPPIDRSVSINSYRTGSLAGMLFVHVSTGKYSDEVKGISSSKCRSLSGALLAAEADHAAKWTAKHGAAQVAEAEFAAYCPRLAA